MINNSLGVDIGNVIIDHRSVDPEVKSVDEATYAAFPETKGVFEALRFLNAYFGGRVFLISKCTEWAEQQILLWLKAHDFYKKTGIKEENIYFVRQRSEKDLVCQKLGLTHFIDDRLEVLSYLVKKTPNLYLFMPNPDEVERFKKFLPDVQVVSNWEEAVHKITGDSLSPSFPTST